MNKNPTIFYLPKQNQELTGRCANGNKSEAIISFNNGTTQ